MVIRMWHGFTGRSGIITSNTGDLMILSGIILRLVTRQPMNSADKTLQFQIQRPVSVFAKTVQSISMELERGQARLISFAAPFLRNGVTHVRPAVTKLVHWECLLARNSLPPHRLSEQRDVTKTLSPARFIGTQAVQR